MNMSKPRAQAQTHNDGAKFLRMATLITTLGLAFAYATSCINTPENQPVHREGVKIEGGYLYFDRKKPPVFVADDSDENIQINPWRGLPSCIYAEGMNRSGAMTKLIALPAKWKPESFAISCQPLGVEEHSSLKLDKTVSELLHARGLLKTPVTAIESGGNFVDSPKGARVARGPDVALTLDVNAQINAQTVADCMTGNAEACRRAGIDMGKFSSFYENARLRSVALIQLDVATGRIEALVSAKSKCLAADEAGSSLDGCPRLPHADPVLRTELLDRRSNRPSGTTSPKERSNLEEFALEQVSMGSIAKPVQALALLRAGREWFDPRQRFPGTDKFWMEYALAKSESEELIDKLLCAEKDFSFPCVPLSNMFQAARDLGLNRYYRRDLLQGNKITSSSGFASLRGGLLMQRMKEKDGDGKKSYFWEDLPLLPLDGKQAQACRAQKWHQCRGDYLATLTAELWGAGNTKANLLDVAEMYARLAQAANGVTRAPVPHLVHTVQKGKTVQTTDVLTDIEIKQGHARDILSALSGTHVFGTADSACRVVYGSSKNCSRLDLSMKTGTPGFDHHIQLNRRFESCEKARSRQQLDACLTRPIKWGVMVTRDNGKYDKVIVVLGERNWHRSNGLVDSGPNASAITAFHFILLRQTTAVAVR